MTNAPLGGIEDFPDIESRNGYAAAVAAGVAPEDVLPGLRAMARDNARTSALAGIPDAQTWAGAELLVGNYSEPAHDLTLRPWEARVYRHGYEPLWQQHGDADIVTGQ